MSPAAVPEKVNNQLCENNEAEMFVTVWLGILELSTGKMICSNAGHEYPAICRGGKKDADITLSAEERQIGGLGILMVKKSMDHVTYEYKDGYNILTVMKNFKKEG